VSTLSPGLPPADGSAEEPWRRGPGLFASLWRHRALIAAATVVAGIAGYGLSLLQEPTYVATAQVFLSNPRTAAVFTDPVSVEVDEYAAQQVLLMRSRAVEERASSMLEGRLTAEDLDESTAAELAEQGGLLIEVAVTDTSPEGAAAAADAVVQAYRDVVTQQSLERARQAAAQLDPQRRDYQERIAALQRQLANRPDDTVIENQIDALNQQLLSLESRAQELLANAGAIGDGVDVAEAAVGEADPVSPAPLRNAVLLAVLGATAGAVLAYWLAGRAREVATRNDPAQIFGAPLLGEIPDYRGRASHTLAGQLSLDPPTTEAYHFVLASIEYALEESGGTSLLVTSAGPGDGKTTTALQLAMAASRDGRRVVLVDADIRAQGLTRMLGVTHRTGLTELATSHLEVDKSVHYLPVSEELLLPVVAAGGKIDDPGSFFRAPGFRKALQRIKDEAELVILDSSPLLAVADTSVIAGQVGGLIIVVDHQTRLDQLQQLRQRLAFVSTPVLGYVYNRSDTPVLTEYAYGYTDDQNGQDGRNVKGKATWSSRLRRASRDGTTARE
jgi:Mrp family chromosome partitioning ATPase